MRAHLKARVPGGLKRSRLKIQSEACFSPKCQNENRYHGARGSPVSLSMSGPSLSDSNHAGSSPHPIYQPLALPLDRLPDSAEIY